MFKSSTHNIWNNNSVATGTDPKPIQTNPHLQNSYSDIPL
jgi:hypothetical protein